MLRIKRKVEVYTADGFSAAAVQRLHPTWSVNSIKTLQKRIRKKMRGEGEEGEAGEEGGALVLGEEGHEDEEAAGTAAEAAAAAAAPVVPMMMAPLPAMGSGDPLPAAAAAAAAIIPAAAAKPAAKKAAAKKEVKTRKNGEDSYPSSQRQAQRIPRNLTRSLGKAVQSLQVQCFQGYQETCGREVSSSSSCSQTQRDPQREEIGMGKKDKNMSGPITLQETHRQTYPSEAG